MSVTKTALTYCLRPVRLEGSHIVPTGAPEVRYSLPQMFEKFAPRGADPGSTQIARQKVVALRAGHYFGLKYDETGVPRNFTIVVRNRDNRIRGLLDSMPTLREQLIELYEVIEARRPSGFSNESSADTFGGVMR